MYTGWERYVQFTAAFLAARGYLFLNQVNPRLRSLEA